MKKQDVAKKMSMINGTVKPSQKGKGSVLMPKGAKNEGENMMIDKKGNQRA